MPKRVQASAAYEELFGLLQDQATDLATSLAARVYRCVRPKWAHPDHLLSGHGSLENGSRWLSCGIRPVCHAASSEWTALAESRGPEIDYAIGQPKRQPRVLVELVVRFSRLADLNALRFSTGAPAILDLLGEDWRQCNHDGFESRSQAIGRAGLNQGFEGLLVPSAREQTGTNLLWFPQSLLPGSSITLVGQEELDRWIVK